MQVYCLQHQRREREDEGEQGRGTCAYHGQVDQSYGRGEQDRREHCHSGEAPEHMKAGEDDLGKPFEGYEWLSQLRVGEEIDVRNASRLEDVGSDSNVSARIAIAGEKGARPEEEREGVGSDDQHPPESGYEPADDPVSPAFHAYSSSPSAYCPMTEPAPGTSRK